MKITLWTYNENLGDGSAEPRIFATKKAAEAAAESADDRWCDDIRKHVFEVDDKGHPIPSSSAEKEHEMKGVCNRISYK